jgi:hypothetical protein
MAAMMVQAFALMKFVRTSNAALRNLSFMMVLIITEGTLFFGLSSAAGDWLKLTSCCESDKMTECTEVVWKMKGPITNSP